jgi:hypothetical protein
MTAEAAEKTPALTPAEAKQLDKLLAKANTGNAHGPAVQLGKPYVALTNLSVPRRVQLDPKDRQTDLVLAGETVYLTDEEAARYLRHGDRDGRRVAVIRAKSEVDANNPPRPHPSLLSGPILRPTTPPPGSDLARPDPAGSSRIVEQSPVPESSEPAPPSRSEDALDITPGTGELARQEIRQGADADLVAAVKSQAPQIVRR